MIEDVATETMDSEYLNFDKVSSTDVQMMLSANIAYFILNVKEDDYQKAWDNLGKIVLKAAQDKILRIAILANAGARDARPN